MRLHFKFIIALIAPILVGIISGLITKESVNEWFISVNKPSFNPPNSVFAPVWTVLYILMGIAFFLVWKSDAPADEKRQAFVFYGIQLALNFLWSLIFFGTHQVGIAFAEIIVLWLMIVITSILFGNISPVAGWLMLPYICWVGFAIVLNFYIWRLN